MYIKKTIISCSLIGKGTTQDGQAYDCQHTWSPVGLILKVPKENILRSGTSDLGANFISPQSEINRYRHTDPGSPNDILRHTYGSYNEVVVLGETEEGGKVEIVGIIFNGRYPNEHTITTGVYDMAVRLHNMTQTPLIEIRSKKEDVPIHLITDEKNAYSKSRVISFTKNDRQFIIPLEGCFEYRCSCNWGIYEINDVGRSHFISDPAEAKMVIDELNNLPDDIKEKYRRVLELIPSQYELAKQAMAVGIHSSEGLAIERELKKNSSLVFDQL